MPPGGRTPRPRFRPVSLMVFPVSPRPPVVVRIRVVVPFAGLALLAWPPRWPRTRSRPRLWPRSRPSWFFAALVVLSTLAVTPGLAASVLVVVRVVAVASTYQIQTLTYNPKEYEVSLWQTFRKREKDLCYSLPPLLLLPFSMSWTSFLLNRSTISERVHPVLSFSLPDSRESWYFMT